MIKRNSVTYDNEEVDDVQPLKRKCVYNDHIYEVSLGFLASGTNTTIQMHSSPIPSTCENPYFTMNRSNFTANYNELLPSSSSSSSLSLPKMIESELTSEDETESRMSANSCLNNPRNATNTAYAGMAISSNHENRMNSASGGRRQNSIRNYFSRDLNSPNRSMISTETNDENSMQIIEPILGNCTCRVCGKIPMETGIYHSCMHCTRSICVPHCSSVCESCGMIFCRFCTTIDYTLNYERIICPDCH